ncbi:hypothetical protein ACFL1R_03320, partial [Candidatus Latescibacterota bacterium]
MDPSIIKINRIILRHGNKYSFYIPTFEFHMFFRKVFDNFQSAVTADYDYRRQDMGFGMSHSLNKYVVNPGLTVEDELYFREVFSDSTGIWRRKQSITPYLTHQITDKSTVGIEFEIEREWSPKRRMGIKIISSQNRLVKVYYLYQKDIQDIWNSKLYYLSFERSYQFFKGEFNYFLIETLLKHSREINNYINYRAIFGFKGNITPQKSPLFFLGGYSNLIGYNNDEFWGKRVFY